MDGCIVYEGSRDASGYGVVYRDKRSHRAHRIAWEDANGPIPDGLLVCHKCDNRPCINVEHLFLGTIQDNNADRHRKGRTQTQLRTITRQQRGDRLYVNELVCERCGNQWLSHGLPKQCANVECLSPFWNKPRDGSKPRKYRMVRLLKCYRCNHQWITQPYMVRRPWKCPACASRKWSQKTIKKPKV